MMLPFTGGLEKILDGTKTMTTRLDAKRHYYFHLNPGLPLHIWWKNPRTRHPECYRVGIVACNWVCLTGGWDFTTEEAKMDGFDSVEDYITALGELNGMNRMEAINSSWTQINWGDNETGAEWLEGPHPRKVA